MRDERVVGHFVDGAIEWLEPQALQLVAHGRSVVPLFRSHQQQALRFLPIADTLHDIDDSLQPIQRHVQPQALRLERIHDALLTVPRSLLAFGHRFEL
ncbi:MAG: hypothetical protein ACLQVI_07170 [Polyangiaceae bacterium]